MAFTLVATHFPPPRSVGTSEADPNRQAIRTVWNTLREGARRLPDPPALLDPIVSDKTLHFVLFFVPALLWSLAAGRRLTGRTGVTLLVALATWSATDEWVQHLTGRDGEWGDWLANVLGSLAGIGIVYPVMRWREARRESAQPGAARAE